MESVSEGKVREFGLNRLLKKLLERYKNKQYISIRGIIKETLKQVCIINAELRKSHPSSPGDS